MKFLNLAGAALNQTPLDWERNETNIINTIQQAKKKNVDILCLPELAITGYGCEDTFFSDYVIQNSLEILAKVAEECEDIVVSVGLPLLFENCVYNVCALIQNTKVLGFVAKQELAGDGVHYEPRWFKRWPEDLMTSFNWDGIDYPLGDFIIEIDGIRIGYEICEDAWTGVRPAEDHYLRNVDIILNPSASHFAFGKTLVRQRLVSETSRSYSCTYIYSNLLGNEAGRIIYDGEIIIAKGGHIYALNKRFSFESFNLTSIQLEIEGIRREKKKSFNFHPSLPQNIVYGKDNFRPQENRERKGAEPIPFYTISKEEEFLKALTLGLFDYMRKSWTKGFAISLSGGADSSACLVLSALTFQKAYQELGLEKLKTKLPHISFEKLEDLIYNSITCVYQGTENSGGATLESASELAKDVGAEFIHWNVQKIFDNYLEMVESSMKRPLDWDRDDLALQNIQARLRSPGIWMIANLENTLLLTTSNRSEAAVGYATMDGDTSGGLAPLGGIDKSFLQEWLKWAEKTQKIDGLKYVNALKPTAELRPKDQNQSDETDLMPYSVLNKIEKSAIRDYKSPVEVFHTLRGLRDDETLKADITKFFKLWARNQWKRERYAPSFHLDDENLDPKTWCRFPILNGGFKRSLEELKKIK